MPGHKDGWNSEEKQREELDRALAKEQRLRDSVVAYLQKVGSSQDDHWKTRQSRTLSRMRSDLKDIVPKIEKLLLDSNGRAMDLARE